MTKIPYTYEIVAVGALSIEVAYTNATHGTMIVGTRRPSVGESLEDVIATASPAIFWDEATRPKADVSVGVTGQGSTQVRPEPTPVLTAEEQLVVDRMSMICSRLQGRLTLGEVTCEALDAVAANPATPWAMRQTILHAIEWQRNSQSMDELAYLLGYGPLEMDVLFRQAMTVAV